jgi:hypothetical protein
MTSRPSISLEGTRRDPRHGNGGRKPPVEYDVHGARDELSNGDDALVA